MITIVAHMRCMAGTEDQIIAASAAFIAATRDEPGCIEFYLHQQRDDPSRFVWYENFTDQVAVDAHVVSQHVADWFGLIGALGAHNEYALYQRLEVE